MSSVLPFSDLFAAKKLNSTVEGVRLGMTTASLNPLDVSPGKDPMDTVVSECIDVGAANIELYANFIEPRVPRGGVGGHGFLQPGQRHTLETIRICGP